MRLYATGLDGDTFEPLYPVLDEDTFGEAMEAFFEARIEGLKALRGGTGRGTHFRGEIERRPLPDQGNPRAVGWTFLIDKDDPEGPAISEILAPLARHRGMADPRAPLIYDAAVPVWDWLDENYFGLGLDDQPPYYVLIAAGPRRIPFQFQSLLDSAAAVGRVCFDDLEHLRTYVKKVIALETAARPVARREVVFWAPDGGPSDATYYSRLYMAQPLAGEVRKQGFKGTSLLGE